MAGKSRLERIATRRVPRLVGLLFFAILLAAVAFIFVAQGRAARANCPNSATAIWKDGSCQYQGNGPYVGNY